MKAVVLERIGEVLVADRPEPVMGDSGDAIVRVTTTAICGSDLHIVHGRDRGIKMGTIMGHEFVGVVEEMGGEVTGIEIGDRVVSPFSVACGNCFYCLRALPARCLFADCFGFVSEEGAGLEGAQAEYVRVPFASSTLMKLTEVSDIEALFLGDILSTAYSAAEGAAIQPGDVVVVIGCGPVGLLAVQTSRLFSPSHVIAVDSVEYRLAKAKSFGAIVAKPNAGELRNAVLELTDGRGADAVIEAVGFPAALDLAISVVRPGATVSIAGYHTELEYSFPIQESYKKNLTVKIGRCNARKYMPLLLPLLLEKKLNPTAIITHTLPLSEAPEGYQIFQNKLENAIKVLLKP